MKRHLLYLSFDGLLEPLGYSQVVRYLLALSKDHGLRYTIASLEKEKDLSDMGRVAGLREQLDAHGITWVYRPYASGGTLGQARTNMGSMNTMVNAVVDAQKVDLIHARSYLSATVALKTKRLHGVPYLFDIRGYWIDERYEEGRWFTNPLVYQAAKAWERRLFEGADGVVSVSKIAAGDITSGRLGRRQADRPVAVIPTCVDYDEFALGREPRPGIIPEAIAARLQGKLVVGFVGSVNAVYCIDEMVRLFGHLLDRRPDAHLLALTRQPEILEEKARAAGIPVEAFTLASAPHDEVADWLYYMDWGLMLRRRSFANRAAMPTKMAEFFARGVRPLQYGCNDEVCDWVNRAGSGLVMNSTAEFDLRQAADFVARSRTTPEMLARARWNTQTHFDLKSGIDRYAEVIERIVEPEKDKLSVLFLTEGKTVPASRFRVEQFIPHLEARGIRCTVRAGYDDRYNAVARRPILGKAYKLLWSLKRIPAAMDAQNFDLLFLQRPALPFSAWPEKFAASRNPRAIFDVDDAIFFAPDGGSDSRMQKTFEAAIKSSAHVICGNDFLAGYARPHGPTTVIPTVIDTERYRPGPARDEDEIVIGWMGTAGNVEYLRDLAGPLRNLARLHDFEFQVIAGHPGVLEELPLSG
ncbi:MAG: glycosyltransferase, partial [Bradymonadaceae bacterium]